MLRGVLIVIRLGLAVMLTTAGVAKLVDTGGSRRAVGDFGVPARFVTVAGTALPIVELLIAVGLVFDRSSRLAATAATALFAVFIAAIVRLVRRGEEVDCHCFGELQLSTAGPKTILRNGFAAALVLYVAISPTAHLLHL